MRNRKIFKTLSSVTGLIIIGKAFGFVKQIIVASKYGTSLETDIFTLAEGFAGDIQYLLTQVLLTSFTAVYIYLKTEDEKSAEEFSTDAIKAAFIIMFPIVLAVAVFGEQIGHLMAPTYDAVSSAKLAAYLRLFSPLLFLFAAMAIFHALLNANERFLFGELTSINQSIILIALVVCLSAHLGIKALVIGFVLFTVTNTVFLFCFSKGYFSLSTGNPFKNRHVIRLLKMAFPLLIGYSAIYINQIVGRILVSGLAEGTVTAMGYASVLTNLVNTFIITFSSILFTYIATSIANKEYEKTKQLSSNAILIMVMLFLPISIVTFVAAEDIVSVVFMRGAFNEGSVKIAAAALRGYALTFVPLVLKEIPSRICYGNEDSKSPMINSSICIIFNILISIALCPRLGVFGVTLASSISVVICGIMNAFSANKYGSINWSFLLKKTPYILVGSGVCFMATSWANMQFSERVPIARFVLTTVAALASYLIVTSPVLLKTYISSKKKAI